MWCEACHPAGSNTPVAFDNIRPHPRHRRCLAVSACSGKETDSSSNFRIFNNCSNFDDF